MIVEAETRCFVLETRRYFLERVTEVVVGERAEYHAQWIGFVMERRGPGREGALASGATPELDNLELLAARAATREVAAAAVRTGVGLLARERHASDAWNWRRHKDWAGYGHRTMLLTEIERRAHAD